MYVCMRVHICIYIHTYMVNNVLGPNLYNRVRLTIDRGM
jgi:hypothetical protein